MICGIDPGITGAVAFYDGNWEVEDMPVMSKASGKGNQVDPYALSSIIGDYCPKIVMVEQVNAMPGQGVTSVFSFGKSAGIIEGILGALDIPVRFVSAAKWKRYFNLTGKDKDAARSFCIREYPYLADRLKRKKDCGRADAILIARYLSEN